MKDAAVKTESLFKVKGDAVRVAAYAVSRELTRSCGPSMYMSGFPKGLIAKFSSALVIIHFYFGSVFLSTQRTLCRKHRCTDATVKKATHGKE